MKILALEKENPNAKPEDFMKYAKAEARRAWELHQVGVIRELYFQQDKMDAVLILECGSVKDAQEALDSLPLVKAGLIHFELIPLRPYDGFERLFAQSE